MKRCNGASHLHGRGQWSTPAPTLFAVRGFDPSSKQFRYEVNPLFGTSTVYRSAFRAPFALTFDFKMELGPDRETQPFKGALRTRVREPADSLPPAAVKGRIDRAINPFRALPL